MSNFNITSLLTTESREPYIPADWFSPPNPPSNILTPIALRPSPILIPPPAPLIKTPPQSCFFEFHASEIATSSTRRDQRFSKEESDFIEQCHSTGCTPVQTEKAFFQKFGYKRRLSSIIARINTVTGNRWTSKSSNRWTIEEENTFTKALEELDGAKPNFKLLAQQVFKGTKTHTQLRAKYKGLNPKFDRIPLTSTEKELIRTNLHHFTDELDGRINWTDMSEELFEGKKSTLVLKSFYRSVQKVQHSELEQVELNKSIDGAF